MAVPSFQSFMRPLLEVVSNREDWRTGELKEAVADRVGLSEDDRSELLPSGKQSAHSNRIGWAKTHLTKAGLLESPKHGWTRITDRGIAALESGETIDNGYLKQYEPFRDFLSGSGEERSEEDEGTTGEDTTPEERFEKLYRTLRSTLAIELLDTVRASNPAFFERLVVELLVAMGYGGSVKDAGRALGKSGDNGIDGVIKQDRLGIDNVYVQAKRWAEGRNVGSPEVRDLAGALQMRKASKGVLITTSDFSMDATTTAHQIGNIVLVNGTQLAELMIEHGVGVTTTQKYEVKRIDQDYFEDA